MERLNKIDCHLLHVSALDEIAKSLTSRSDYFGVDAVPGEKNIPIELREERINPTTYWRLQATGKGEGKLLPRGYSEEPLIAVHRTNAGLQYRLGNLTNDEARGTLEMLQADPALDIRRCIYQVHDGPRTDWERVHQALKKVEERLPNLSTDGHLIDLNCGAYFAFKPFGKKYRQLVGSIDVFVSHQITVGKTQDAICVLQDFNDGGYKRSTPQRAGVIDADAAVNALEIVNTMRDEYK